MNRMVFVAAIVLAIGMSVPGMAVETGRSQVNVTTCQPSRNAMVSGGWVPGYYPRGAYYFPSVYGYRYHQPPVVTSSPTLAIDYTNITSKPMSQIEFGLIANGNLVAEVRDVGTFSPGTEIKHEFGLSPNVFPLQTALARCVPLRITYQDGTTWTNPHLPRLLRRLRG